MTVIALCKAIGYNLWTKATFCTSKPALGKAPYLHAHSLESWRKSLTKWPHFGVNELEQGRHAQPCCRTTTSIQTEPQNQHILLVISASFALKTRHPFLNQSLIRDSRPLCCSELHYVSFVVFSAQAKTLFQKWSFACFVQLHISREVTNTQS